MLELRAEQAQSAERARHEAQKIARAAIDRELDMADTDSQLGKLANLKFDFETAAARYRTNAQAPGLLEITRNAETPVLVDDSLQLYDSTVILEFLEDLQSTPQLYPRPAAVRARCRLLETQADESVWPCVAALMSAQRSPEPTRLAEANAGLRACHSELDRNLGARAYFCETYSVADIAHFAHLDFGCRLGASIELGTPSLYAWFERMSVRPAVAAVRREIDAALLRALHASEQA